MTKTTASPRKAAKPKQDSEKRLKRFRSNPTIGITQRIQRAVHQRLFLVQILPPTTCPLYGGPSVTLSVLGSTGNVYEVTISKIPSCTCPDHLRNNNLCKHLLFAMLKVVGLPVESNLVYQSAYVSEELERILIMLQERTACLGRDNTVLANEAVRQRHEDMKQNKNIDCACSESSSAVKRKEIGGGECPICFDSLGSDISRLTFCQQTCGTNFHSACIQMWTKQAAHNPTCPACRQPWVSIGGGKRNRNDFSGNEGYTNLGALQGQSPVRGTSTYDSIPRRFY
eukprot:CAMPEP_0194242614 /NCGR_PEP_ID=MMETSP0158-20130606/8100_1 /TAXON_ID=33649 /ORGANISM="Thalassionema nitzschioides, Strain L26-B" /LENGTH=283 /DNA_ID=CAMNT_0038977739 /DNA_START=8 /DNA_END=856 /DNA_ORIENTATION=-